eukprot:3935241-Rhodomonas_salina.2
MGTNWISNVPPRVVCRQESRRYKRAGRPESNVGTVVPVRPSLTGHRHMRNLTFSLCKRERCCNYLWYCYHYQRNVSYHWPRSPPLGTTGSRSLLVSKH